MHDLGHPPDGPLVLVAGLYGSGSTWAYNAVRALLDDAGPLRAGYSDDADALPAGEAWQPTVVKCHLPDAGLRRLARTRAATVVITVRDPRDAVVSTVRRFGLSSDAVRQAVVVSAQRLLALADGVPAVVLRYEDGFTQHAATVERLARALLVDASAARVAAISEGLSAARVSAQIDAMTRDGAFGPAPSPLSVDAVTQWHPTHLGDGRVGKYQGQMHPDEAARLMAQAADFCARFGYA